MQYTDFLESKRIQEHDAGFDVPLTAISETLYPFQRDIVQTALRKGRYAIFASCGLGKTLMQLEWSWHVHKHTSGDVLIVAPLAVTVQTRDEAKKIGLTVTICRKQDDVQPGVNITNYEMIDHFDTSRFVAVVLDESSILKSYSGKIKQKIFDMFRDTHYKLCCTATPSPNDHMEILNHAEFLGAMKSSEALAVWFINDTMKMGTYRLKNHAVKDFWTWVSSWAVSVDKPSDFGYEDGGFILPKLNIIEHVVPVDFYKSAGDKLFRIPALSATDYHKEKRLTAEDRAVKAKEIVDGLDGIVCIWCETNYEADALKTLMPDAVEIRGDDSIDRKEQVALDFAAGKISCLISKPSIFGFGLNFQACHNVVFCGMSYSFEAFYQATRRFWRFGQTKPVDVHIVIGETEKHILDVVQEKEEKYTELKNNMQSAMNQVQELSARRSFRMDYERRVVENSHYKLILGDAIEEIKTIDSESVHFTIFSPPFSTLYIYSDSLRDMGNNRDDDMFFRHFGFLMEDLHRITIPGRLCAIHCKQLVNYKGRDGQAGLRDFRGDIIRLMQAHGWAYHSEVTIWKDPVIEMQRTKSHGLLYKQLRKDSTFSRQGLPDYLVVFRKWAEDYVDPEPVTHTKEDFELDKWQRYASPVWFDIRQTNVLNIQAAREDGDEKHICPLQLDVIERALELWTNPGDVVFSPFAGIGSEGYGAIKAGRRFLGIELKDKYFDQAVRNLNAAIHTANVPDLFAEAELACTTQD